MNQTVPGVQEEWLKVLGKGMVTLPKRWRKEMGIDNGDIVKAKKEGNKVTIVPAKSASSVPYRIYSKIEIEEFLKDDQIPRKLAQKAQQNL